MCITCLPLNTLLTGVRGAIWFIMWPVLFIIFVLLYSIVELEVTVTSDPDRLKPKVYTLSVGGGGARTTANAAAQRDLQTVRQCMYIEWQCIT